MLDAGAGAGDEQRGIESHRAAAEAGQRIASRGEHRPEDQHRPPADMIGEPARGHLQRGHGAGIETAQQRERDIVEPELGPPDRKEHVDGVGVAVMQGVREAGEGQGAPAGLAALRTAPTMLGGRRRCWMNLSHQRLCAC